MYGFYTNQYFFDFDRIKFIPSSMASVGIDPHHRRQLPQAHAKLLCTQRYNAGCFFCCPVLFSTLNL
jgi:hypothetical protein